MLAPVPPPKRLISSWEQALALLRARSPDLRRGLDQVLQAEAATRIAVAAYLPTIVGTGLYTHNLLTNPVVMPSGIGGLTPSTRVPLPDVATGNVQLQQAVINVQAFDQISIDALGEDVAHLSLDDARRTLTLSVANQIIAVVTAEREADINRVGLRVALEQLELTKLRQGGGVATDLDVVRATQNAASARATLLGGDEALHQTREALGLSLGLSQEVGVLPGIEVGHIAERAAGSCERLDRVEERADVAAARAGLDLAKRNLRNVYWQFLPTAEFLSTVATTTNPAFGSPNPTWNVQAVVSVPIWDGGARYGTLRAEDASRDLAAVQLDTVKRQATIELEQAQRQLTLAGLSDRVAHEQRDLAAQNDQMTQLAYAAGQGTSLELTTASAAHRQAELNLAVADFAVVKARLLAVLTLSRCSW